MEQKPGAARRTRVGRTRADDGIKSEAVAVPIQIRLREEPDAETRFVNHAIASFNGTEFILSLAQAVPPADRTGPEWERVLQERELEARVIVQVAMPVDKFVEMAENFWHLVNGLRARGLIRAAEGDRDAD